MSNGSHDLSPIVLGVPLAEGVYHKADGPIVLEEKEKNLLSESVSELTRLVNCDDQMSV